MEKSLLPELIIIGREGEQYAREIQLDISAEMALWPNSSPQLIYTRPGETDVYIAVTTHDGTTLTWVPDAFPLEKNGISGAAQIIFTTPGDEQTIIGKSKILGLYVKDSLQEGETPPDPYESWLAALTDLAAQTEQYAADAETSAERAEQAAATAGYMDFRIVAGRLIYQKCNVDNVDFDMVNGRLIAKWL